MEFSAKGVEVTQQGTTSELRVSFIASTVTVQTCPGHNAFKLLPHTCSADSDAATFASPLAEIEQDEPVLFELEAGLQGGLESERGLYRFDLVLVQDDAEPGQGLVYLVLWKS